MNDKMFDICISTDEIEGYICIIQLCESRDKDLKIAVHPKQVDFLIKQIKNAKNELLSKCNNDEDENDSESNDYVDKWLNDV